MNLLSASEPALGIGWREEIALFIERRSGLGFVEVLAEDLDPGSALPLPIARLRERGVAVVPHGVTLSLGGADPPETERLRHLGRLALRLGAPLVSEHIAFVRAGGIESGHLLPIPRTREALGTVVENVRRAQDSLPVPLALENVASLLEWPCSEMDEADFLAEILEQTGALLLLDVSNLLANAWNHRWDPRLLLDRIPLKRIVYAHIGGGVEREGVYHDTHAHPVPRAALDLLEEICSRTRVGGVLLERDDSFPPDGELDRELESIGAAAARGASRRAEGHVL